MKYSNLRNEVKLNGRLQNATTKKSKLKLEDIIYFSCRIFFELLLSGIREVSV